MKSSVTRLGFLLRFAYKNIIRFKLKSFLLTLSLTFLISALLLSLSASSFTKSYFYENLENRYRDIDFSMSTSINTNTRFFSIRPLIDFPELEHIIEDYAFLLETNALIEIDGNKNYVLLMSSSLADFKKISNPFLYPNAELGANEVVVTASLAKKNNLEVADTLTIFVKNTTKHLQIVRIVEDGGLFADETIYLNKEFALSFFFPELPTFILQYLGNKIYFNVKDDISIDYAMTTISSIDEFSNLEFEKSIDEVVVNQLINRNVAVFNLIIILVLIATLLVMQTTFLMYFRDKKKTFAMMSVLGGRKKFSYGLVIVELFVFFIISFTLSIHVVNLVFSAGLASISSSAIYTISLLNIFYASLIALSICLVTSFYYFYTFNKTSSIEQSKDAGIEKRIRILPISVFLVISLLAILIFKFDFVNLTSWNFAPIAQSIIIFTLFFCLVFFLIYMVTRILGAFKKTKSFFLYLKILLSKSSFYQFITVFILCSMSIFLLVLLDEHMDHRNKVIANELKVDFALTSFTSHYSEIYDELSTLDAVKSATKVGLFKNISFSNLSQNLETVVSLDPIDIQTYFLLPIDTNSLDALSRTDRPIILLPLRYQYLFDMKVGDIIHLNITPEQSNIDFEIGGFFEKEFSNLAFINLHNIDDYVSIGYNSIFIIASADPSLLKNHLLSQYSNNLVYVIDFQEITSSIINSSENAKDYMLIILTSIIMCFVLAIFNHSLLLLGQMKPTYARLFVLGYSKQKMIFTLAIQSIILLFIILFSSAVAFVLFSNQLTPLLVLLGEYENIIFLDSSLVIGIVIVSSVFALTQTTYILGVLLIKPAEIVKTF